MPRRPVRAVGPIAACVVVWLGATPIAQGAARIKLRNSLKPGLLAIYTIDVDIRRLSDRPGQIEALRYQRPAQWAMSLMRLPDLGKAQLAQLRVDRPAEVSSLRRGGEPVRPLLRAETLGLPDRFVQFNIAAIDWRDTQGLTPLIATPLDRCIDALLDFAHWPADATREGESWTREVAWPGVTGTQTFALDSVFRREAEQLAVITVVFEPRFDPRPGRELTVEHCRAKLVWSHSHNVAQSLSGRVVLRRKTPRTTQQTTAQIDLRRRQLSFLDEDLRDANISELNILAKLVTHYRRGQHGPAREIAQEFVSRHSTSPWWPLPAWILERLDQAERLGRPMAPDRLNDVLATLLARWQAAAADDDPMLRDACRRALARVAKANRGSLMQQCSAEAENERAVGAFALAFTADPAVLELIERLAKDPSARVRAWAAYGLAILGARQTSRVLLLNLLSDDDPRVRVRTAQAVKACVGPADPRRSAFSAALIGLLRDPSPAVRLHAAGALGRLVSTDQRSALRAARDAETDPWVRRALDAALAPPASQRQRDRR